MIVAVSQKKGKRGRSSLFCFTGGKREAKGDIEERQKGTQLIVLLYTVILLCREAKGDIVLIDKSRMSPFAIL